jgi:carboxypeptidase T
MRLLVLSLFLFASASRAETADKNGWFDGKDGSATPASVSDAAKKAAEKKIEKPALAGDDRYWVIIEAADKKARQAVANSGVSIEGEGQGQVAGVASPKALQKLKDLGIRVVKQTSLRVVSTEDFPTTDSAYHNYAENEAELKAIAAAAPELASVFSIGQSWQGRSISALRLNTSAKGAQASKKPGAVFMGTHHAREHLSTEVPLLIAKWIVENRGRADVKKLLEDRDVYFIPMVNPDGAEYDIAAGKYRWQRKNMRKNSDGSVGVDLNRNYDFRFGGEGTSDEPGDDTYHGPSAFSEPESKAVKAFFEARPNLKTFISYHSFSELVLYPWGGADEPISDQRALKAYKAMAEKMAGWTGYRAQQSSDLYVATGDTCDWSWEKRKVYSFTIELTPASQWAGGFYPGAAAISSAVEKNLQPVLYLIGLSDNPLRAADEAN